MSGSTEVIPEQPTNLRWFSVPSFCGLSVTALGLMVMLGWHLHKNNLIQVLPILVPMQYNTALCFLAAGLGLFFAAIGRHLYSMLCAFVPLFIGAGTLLEYGLQLDLGIDQLFMQHYITVRSSSPGRMALPTAVAHSLGGLFLLLIPSPFLQKRFPGIAVLLGGAVCSLGILAIAGYASGLESAHGWGGYTQMAIHTAVGLIVLGCGMAVRAWTLAMNPQATGRPMNHADLFPSDPFHPGTISIRWRVAGTAVVVLGVVALAIGSVATQSLYSAIQAKQADRLLLLARTWAGMIEITERMDRLGGLLHVQSEWPDTDFAEAFQRDYSIGLLSTVFEHFLQSSSESRIVIARLQHGKLEILYEGTRGPLLSRNGLLDDEGVRRGLQEALARRSGTLQNVSIGGISSVMAYTPLENLGWAITVSTSRNALQLEMAQTISVTFGFGAVVLATGVLFLVITLNPLVSQLELRTHLLSQANVRMHQEIAEKERAEGLVRLNEARLEALVKLNQMSEASLGEIAEYALEEAVRLTQSDIGYVAFVNEDETVMTMHAWSAKAMAQCRIKDKPIVYPVASTGLWGEAIRQRRAVITNDYSAPNPWKKGAPEGHVQVRRHMNAPIFDGNHIVVVAGVGNKEQEYNESDVRQLTLLMSGMWRTLQRNQAQEFIRQHRDNLEEVVNIRTAELRNVNRYLESLLYVTSHDLKEPLRAIESFSKIVEKEYADRLEGRGRDYLNRVVNAAKRMSQLLENILALSRVRRSDLPMETIDVSDVVADVLKRLELKVQETRGQVRVAEPLPQLRANRMWVSQAVYNLVANALKFTRPGEAPDVEIERYEVNGEQGIVVRDRGPGVAPEHAARIFELFQRAVGREVEGTGAGLAIVQAVAERHGGRVWVQARPGGGAEFILTLGRNGSEKAQAIATDAMR